MTVPTAGVVELRVTQLSPSCRAAGRIVLHAHSGRNVVLFRARVGGKRLAPGTYRITPRLKSGAKLRSIVVVVVAGAAPGTAELAARRAANACTTGGSGGEASGVGASGSDVSPTAVQAAGGDAIAEGAAALASSSGSKSKPKPKDRGGVLGADFTQTLRDPTSVSPVLLILLAIAICLLSLAALPRTVVASPVLAEQLTNRRLELTLAGTATLLVVVLTYMLF